MERTINTLWFFCGDFSMITLAKKLITCSGTTEVNGYVEFVSSTPMTITPKYTNSGVTLRYSLDGITWTPIVSGVTTPSANIIYFIGRAAGTKSLYTANSSSNAWAFSGATNLECNGKLDRLLQYNLGGDNDILTIGANCFNYMFYNATTLIKAPELPATSLATYCYGYMFYGCTNLTAAPILPATTLVDYCYDSMFYGCTGLTIAPELPAMILGNSCYADMFYGCTSLKLSTTLPATTLIAYCYFRMFYGCTNLTAAPELPATTLATYCYYKMFYGCTSLKLSTTMTGIYDTSYRIPTTGTGITATNALTNTFITTGGTFIGTPEINTTYYTENTPV